MKPGNAGGAKGGREANASSERLGEDKCSGVPTADKQGQEAQWRCHDAERGVWSEKMLAALESGVKGNKWFSLIDKVYAERTVELAWEKVRSNAGVSGVDGITVEHFGKESRERLHEARRQLMGGTYQPKPLKRAWIPKPGSAEKRPLGIPTVRDRVVQTALKMVMEPIFEREFASQSYGYRPGRSGHGALRRVDELLKQGYVHVVDIDIQGYFDAIPHGRLMEKVGEHVADGRVLGLIEAFLKQGVMEGGESQEVEGGTPQGGVISPLLANIYLNPLDWLMEQAGLQMVRYADDMVVLCRDIEMASRAMEKLQEWMEAAGLELNGQKTRVVDMAQVGNHFDFLGYRFWRGKGGNLRRFIRPKSRNKLRKRLKPLTRRTSGESLQAIVAVVNPILKGWYGYFKHACADALDETDGWIRGRLRSILRKRHGGQGRARGRDHQRWGNHYFTELGLLCLQETRASEIASLRHGA
jgi:RNA-directed DNA polymerase